MRATGFVGQLIIKFKPGHFAGAVGDMGAGLDIDISLDIRTGDVYFIGPASGAEKQR